MTIPTTKARLHFSPIPAAVAAQARQMRKDRFGHDLNVYRDRAPCRVCLRIAKEPEDLILLSYRPLADRTPYAEIGPIFIHKDECAPYERLDVFPEDFRSLPLVLRAYDDGGAIVDAAVAAPGQAESLASSFFANAAIAEVHVRHTTYTCFDFKIERG